MLAKLGWLFGKNKTLGGKTANRKMEKKSRPTVPRKNVRAFFPRNENSITRE